MARNTSHSQSLDANNIGASLENNESLNPILCAAEKVRKTTIIALTAFGLASCQSAIADKKHLHEPIQVADASGESIILAAKQAEKIQQVKGQTKVEKVIVPTVRKQAFENQKNVELSDMRGAKFDEESSSNKLDLRGSVPDSEGEVTLANYEKSSLSASDLDAGKKEFLSTIKQDPEFSQDSEENLLGYWKEIITAFFNGVNDGGAEYIAKYAPEFTDKILKNSDEYKLAIVLDTEMKKIKIAAGEARIKSLNKLSTTLKGE